MKFQVTDLTTKSDVHLVFLNTCLLSVRINLLRIIEAQIFKKLRISFNLLKESFYGSIFKYQKHFHEQINEFIEMFAICLLQATVFMPYNL